MWQFSVPRLLYRIVTLLILSATIFIIVRLTGDPVSLLAESGARPEDLERIHRQWGLDRSWPVQYVSFLQNIVTGELGKSFNYRLPVSELYFQRLPNSLTLGEDLTQVSPLVGGLAHIGMKHSLTPCTTISHKPIDFLEKVRRSEEQTC